jgi:hypothetical protein
VITEALISFVAQAARAVLGLVPQWSPPAHAFGQMSHAFGAYAAVGNGYFPVVVTGVCLGLVLALKVGLLAWRVVIFVYHQFWGSN